MQFIKPLRTSYNQLQMSFYIHLSFFEMKYPCDKKGRVCQFCKFPPAVSRLNNNGGGNVVILWNPCMQPLIKSKECFWVNDICFRWCACLAFWENVWERSFHTWRITWTQKRDIIHCYDPWVLFCFYIILFSTAKCYDSYIYIVYTARYLFAWAVLLVWWT